MKLYDRKKLIISIGELLLAIGSIVTIIIEKGTDLKSIILSVFCLILGMNGIIRSFSRKKSCEAINDGLDERTQLVDMAVNSKMLKIHSVLVVSAIIVGIISFKITTNIMIMVAILPLMMLLPITFFIYLILYIYYDKKM